MVEEDHIIFVTSIPLFTIGTKNGASEQLDGRWEVWCEKVFRQNLSEPTTKPGMVHRFTGIAGVTEIFEFSSHHEDADSYRVPGEESGAFEWSELENRVDGLA